MDHHGLEGTRVPAGVAADRPDRTDREVPRQPQGGGVHVHPGVHPAGDPRKGEARREQEPLIFLLFYEGILQEKKSFLATPIGNKLRRVLR